MLLFQLFQSEVFAVAFAVLAAGAIILTLNVLLLVSSLRRICSSQSPFMASTRPLVPAAGRAHHLLSEPQPPGLLPVPSGCGGPYLPSQRQRHHQAYRCDHHAGVELLGSIPIYERRGWPQEESLGPLPGLPHVCLCWLPHHCHLTELQGEANHCLCKMLYWGRYDAM